VIEKFGDFRDEMQNAIDIAKKRQDEYGKSYKQFHKQMMSFFPNGLILKTEKDFELYSHFQMCIVKLNRFSSNITRGEHKNSAIDLINYSAMQSESCVDVQLENDNDIQ